MAYAIPEGSLFQFSSTFAATKAITTISNADPAAVGSVAHGYSDADEVLADSGWEDVTDTVWQVNQTSVDAYELLGLNSTNTNFFPAGAGVGTTSKISSWQTIPQVLGIATQGGDARFTDVSPLAKRNALKIPTGFNATSVTLTLGHDPSNAVYKTMVSLSRSLTKVAFRMVLSGGGKSYGYGYMTVSETPSLNVNQVNTVQAAFAFLGRSISYDT
jgi:hypothetical protein